jgi:membrane protease YdiL (CAAX protease family)
VVVFACLISVLPAYVVSGAYSSALGVRDHLKTLLRPRGIPVWYLVALLTFPAVQLTGAAVTRIFGGTVELHLGGYSAGGAVAAAALTFLNGFFFAGGINEETGWRGFALPRLQSRHSPLAAASIVWLFWALWHLPYDLASGEPALQVLQNRVFFNFLWSVLFAWVFNNAKGSVLAPALFHPAMNTSGDVLPRTDAATALFVIIVAFAILRDRMWRRLPADHCAVKEC